MRLVVGGGLVVGGLIVVYGALTGRLAPMLAALIRPTDLVPDGGGGMAIAGTGSTPDIPANPFGRFGYNPLQGPKQGA